MRKPNPEKKAKLIAYIKQHSTFYAYDNFEGYKMKDLQMLKREIAKRLKDKPGPR